MSEIAKSYELIGRIFEKLILSGLRKIPIDAIDVASEDDPDLYNGVIDFLLNEKLIRAENVTLGGRCFGAQLTSNGLAAIDNLRFSKENTIRAEVEASKGTLSASTYTKIGSFIGGVIGGATKAIGT